MSTTESDNTLQEKAAAVRRATNELTRAVNLALEVGLEVELDAHEKIYENGIARRIYQATVKKVTVTRY